MADITLQIDAVDNASNAINGIRGAIMTFNQVMMAAQMVAGTVKQAYDATIGTFATYAAGIKNMTVLTGDTVSDMSRLMTITNDYGVTVSDLTMAQKSLAKTGQSLSVDTLAQMSDSFRALSTGVEKTDFLVKNFGRSGADLATVMNLGSVAIMAQAAAVNSNLVLDDQMMAKADALRLKTAQFNDEIEAEKIEIGEKLTPVMISLLNYNDDYEKQIDTESASFIKYIPLIGSLYDMYELIASATGHAQVAQTHYTGALGATNTELDKWLGRINVPKNNPFLLDKGEIDNTDASLTAFQQNVTDAIKATADAEIALQKSINDTTSWETMATASTTAADKAKNGLDLLGTDIQGLGSEGANVWNGFLASTGQISAAAIVQFANIERVYQQVKWDIDHGISMPFIISYINGQMSSISGNDSGGDHGDFVYKGTKGGPGTGSAWWSPTKGWHYGSTDTGWAQGGDFIVPPGYPNDSYGMRVQSGEHVTVTPPGKESGGGTRHFNYGTVHYHIGTAQPNDWLQATRQ